MTLQGYERRLSHRDRKRIGRTLRPLRDGVNLTEALDDVEAVTQWYWLELEYQRRRLPRKEIANELVEISKCAGQLLGAVNLIKRDGWFELNSQLQSAQRQSELDRMGAPRGDLPGVDIERASLAEVVAYTECLRSAARNFDPRGRPREIVLSVFAAQLALIYEDATGTKPRRRYNGCRQHQGEAEHLPFFAACMTAAGVTKYPARIIRQALES